MTVNENKWLLGNIFNFFIDFLLNLIFYYFKSNDNDKETKNILYNVIKYQKRRLT